MKRRFIIAAIICLVLCLVFVLLAFTSCQGEENSPVKEETIPPSQIKPQSQVQESPAYVSPIDFESLQKDNADICAWLEIPGTEISYPVLQSKDDDSYYLNHNVNKKSDTGGALFIEHVYNKNDFSDPVTAVYGCQLRSGEMFGDLQKYYTDDFEKYKDLIIYTSQEEIHYEVFAAVQFTNRHILYYYNGFSDEQMMSEFISDLKSVRAIGSYIDKDIEISSNDQLLVLSTCLKGDRTSRFLVVGKRMDR